LKRSDASSVYARSDRLKIFTLWRWSASNAGDFDICAIESPKGKTCDAIVGILDEGKEIMGALDAGLLAAAQAVEHYEISRYGTLKCWDKELGYSEAVKLLDATLKEEKNTDSALSQLAESDVNGHAGSAQAA